VWRHAKSSIYGVILVLATIGIVSPTIATATREIQTNICGDFIAPTIVLPVSGFTTNDDSVTVAGEGEVSLPVTITENGTAVAVTTVLSSGEYSISIPLVAGGNTIIAKEVNACGSVKESAATSVQRNVVLPPTGGGTVAQEPTPVKGIASAVPAQSASNALNQPISGDKNTPGFSVPVIHQPLPGTVYTTSEAWVTGTAEPSSMVTLYINDMSVARLRVSPTGNFGVTVELNKGRNSIQVEAEKDGKSAISQTTVVTYTPPTSTQKGTSPLAVAASIIGVAAVVAAAAGVSVWVVKLIKTRRLW